MAVINKFASINSVLKHRFQKFVCELVQINAVLAAVIPEPPNIKTISFSAITPVKVDA